MRVCCVMNSFIGSVIALRLFYCLLCISFSLFVEDLPFRTIQDDHFEMYPIIENSNIIIVLYPAVPIFSFF